MADAYKHFERILIGHEVVNGGAPGTAVTPTFEPRGIHKRKKDPKRTAPDEGIGQRFGNVREIEHAEGDGFTWGTVPLTYEEFCYWMNAMFRMKRAGIKDGAGSGYIRTWEIPVTKAQQQITSTGIAFVSSTKKITNTGNALDFVKTGDTIKVSNSASNNGYFTVATGGVAAEIVVAETLVNESASASVTVELVTDTYTVQHGNNLLVEQAAMMFPLNASIGGNGGQDLDFYTISGEWAVQQWNEVSDFQSGISPIAVHDMLFGNTKMYIDAVGGTIGTTLKTAPASVKIALNSGLSRKYGAGGYLYYTDIIRGVPSIELDISLWLDANAKAEYTAFKAQTTRLLRLKVEGANLTTAGSVYSKYTCIFDLPGVWSAMQDINDVNSALIVPAKFRVAYDNTAAVVPTITVVNELSTLA